MILELSLLIVGLILLVIGSDKFVDSSSRIAKKLGVSDFIIGLTLIAVGTSLPELAAAIASALKGSSGLIVGNLVGSNIANIGLIVGICALIGAIKTHEIMLKRDGYIMLFVSGVFALLAINGVINYIEGLILLTVYLVYVLFLIESKKIIKTKFHFKEFITYFLRFKFIETLLNLSKNNSKKKPVEKKGLAKEFIISAISLAALIYGAKLLINYSLYFSSELGISETFIGLALVAIGTSLPELAVSVSAIRKGFNEILIGNIIGSNIANISLVFGISALIVPVQIAASSLYYLIPAMLIFSVLFLVFIKKEWKINRSRGIILLALYLLFLLFAGFKGI
jgi:cation:H+ antiporter